MFNQTSGHQRQAKLTHKVNHPTGNILLLKYLLMQVIHIMYLVIIYTTMGLFIFHESI